MTPRGDERERWLVLAEESFLPATSGGRVETLNFVRAVEQSGIDLELVVPIKASQERVPYQELLDETAVAFVERRTGLRPLLGIKPYIFASRPVPPRFVQRFLRRAPSARPTAVISYSFRVAHMGVALAASLGVPHLVRCLNLESSYFDHIARSATRWRSGAYRAEWWRVRRAEAAIHRSAHVTCFADISLDDHRARRTLTDVPTLHLPPFLPTARHSGRHPVPCSVTFVGSLDSAVNREAVGWLLDSCWRLILAQHPTATLRIVGRKPSEELRRAVAESTSVELLADVPTIGPLLAATSVFANPVQRGAGVNIKVVEAMTAGVPVVATTAGSRGLPWEPGRHLLVADRPTDFANRVSELLADPVRREMIGEAGRQFIVDALDPAVLLERVRDALHTRHLS